MNEEEEDQPQFTEEISTAGGENDDGSASLSDNEVQNISQEDDADHPSPDKSKHILILQDLMVMAVLNHLTGFEF